MVGHEQAFADAFVHREKRARYRQFLANPKRRRQVLDRLNHGMDIDRSWAIRIMPADRSAAAVARLLRKKGSGPICHVIADGLEIDGQDVLLSEALAQVEAHDFGVVLSCIPGQLAFYKEEAPGEWFVLERRSGA